jgi:adenine C2-methylase RlmN of 23S rRNA A2503 and tRNA A37
MKNELKYYLVDIDKTEKFVFENEYGILEIIRINTKPDRDIYCVPSMYECKLGCTMCYLTINNITGSNKKVTFDVIQDCLKTITEKYQGKTQRQISVMGVGEPLLNLELIYNLCDIESRVSIASIFPFIPEKPLPSNLKIHYSLHSPLQDERLEIMPNAKVDPFKVINFLKNHKGKCEIHYTLIDGVNDSNLYLECMVSMFDERNIPIKFLDFKTSYKNEMSKSNKITHWMKVLNQNNIETEFYYPPGENIQSSCGLFTEGFYTHKPTDEFNLLLKQYSKPLK